LLNDLANLGMVIWTAAQEAISLRSNGKVTDDEVDMFLFDCMFVLLFMVDISSVDELIIDAVTPNDL
jgi:hypothetical protein